MNLELVYWRDAHFSKDDMQESQDYIIRTVGWTKKSGRFLWIEAERTPDGPRAVTRVPLENVVKRATLVVGDGK